MKKIEAIIRKSKFDEVVKALHDAEVYFFSYWDVTGVGNEKIGKVYRGITYSTKDIQRRYLSIVVSDTFVDATVDAIIKSGATGNVGDGKIAGTVEAGDGGPSSPKADTTVYTYEVLN